MFLESKEFPFTKEMEVGMVTAPELAGAAS
jgi:hypothetical protein